MGLRHGEKNVVGLTFVVFLGPYDIVAKFPQTADDRTRNVLVARKRMRRERFMGVDSLGLNDFLRIANARSTR